ncbi:hypothetical protein B0A48_02020 [Cryoendolithus antarcticus]|uniref:Uncharacterized protein n=1 Tax=Cryoendolithus antarcticus TaxID=1507870 RepID=A0A1V8TR77_9PEZI|nr:hypothetical protein B0A48_02020 [Cryoendolithus antarcticus]
MEDAESAQVPALRLRCPVPLIDDFLGRSVFYEERRGDFALAREAADTASAEARLHDDTISLVSALVTRGIIHQLQGNVSVSNDCLEEAINLSGGTPELQYRALVYSSQISSLMYDYFPDGGAAFAKDIQPNFDTVLNLRAWTDRITEARSFVNNKALLLEGRMLQRRRTVMRPPRIGADRYDATNFAQLRIWASSFQADRDWCESDKADARQLAALDLLLGDVLFKAGDLPKALEKVEKATETYRALDDTIGKANCESKLGDFLASPRKSGKGDRTSQDPKAFEMRIMEEVGQLTQDASNLMSALPVIIGAKSSEITGTPVARSTDTLGDVAVTEFAKLMIRQSFFYENLYRGKQARRLHHPRQAEKFFAKAKHIAQTDNAFHQSFMNAMISAYQDQAQNAVQYFNIYLEEEYQFSRVFESTPVLQEDNLRNVAGQALSFFCEMEGFSDAQRYIDILLQLSGEDWWQQGEHPWDYLRLIAIVEEGTGKFTQALDTYKHAMDLFEQCRRRLSIDQLKLAFANNSTTQSIYFKATRVALKLREHASDEEQARAFEAEAFRALERGKARSLLDLMASGTISKGEELRTDVAVRRWRKLGAFLASRAGLLQVALSERNPDAENIAKLKKDILDTEEELHVAEIEISTDCSTNISLTSDVVNFDHLVAKMNNTTAILQSESSTTNAD